MIDEYRKCSDICAKIDYSDNQSVRRYNNAVSRMYNIVRSAAESGPEVIEKLTVLLDEPRPARWLAHLLVELAEIPPKVEDKCFEIIETLSKGDGADAMGERMWLDEWKNKKGRV